MYLLDRQGIPWFDTVLRFRHIKFENLCMCVRMYVSLPRPFRVAVAEELVPMYVCKTKTEVMGQELSCVCVVCEMNVR